MANFSHTIEIPDSHLPIHYSFYGAKMTFTGRLLSAHPMLKLFSDKDF